MTISHKILKALLNGPRTVDEITSEINEERKRIVSNFGPICHSKLADRILGADGMVEYKITDKGIQHYHRNGHNQELIYETPAPITETTAPIAETPAPIAETPAPIADATAPNDETTAPMDETMTSEEQIVIEESPPYPDQYAICRSERTPKTAWQIAEMTLDAAKDLAMIDATAINGEVILYRLVPIGRAVPRVIFEEA